MTPYGKIFKNMFRKFSPPWHCCVKCRKICPTENRWNRALFTSPKKNKISAPSQIVATAQIAPKICLGQPPTFGSQRSEFHSYRFTFGRVIAERVNAVLLAHEVFAIFARTSGE